MKSPSFNHVLGLEVDANTIRAVYLSRRGPFVRVRSAERLRLPADTSAALELFRNFIEKNGWRQMPCVVGLRGSDLVLRVISLSAAGRSFNESIEQHMEQFRGLSVGETISDYSLLSADSGSRRALLGVARAGSVEKAIELPLKAGLRVVDVIPAPLAVFFALRFIRGWDRGTYAGVHISEHNTEVVIARGNDLLFLRRFEVGRRHLASAEGEEEGVDRWVRELKSCIKLYQDRGVHRHRRPREVVLCGDQPPPSGLRSAVSRAIGLPVRHAADLNRAQRLPEMTRYMPAAGLALIGTGWSKRRISLMPPALRESLTLRWQFKYWFGAAAALFIMLTFVAMGMTQERRRQERRCRRLERRLRRFESSDATLRNLNESSDALLTKLRPLRASVRNGAVVQQVLRLMMTTRHPHDWLTLVADAHSYFGRGIEGRNAPRETQTRLEQGLARDTLYFTQLIVEGYTPEEDLSTVHAMIAALRDDPLVADADLLADDQLREDPERDARWEDAGARLFAVEIKLNREDADVILVSE